MSNKIVQNIGEICLSVFYLLLLVLSLILLAIIIVVTYIFFVYFLCIICLFVFQVTNKILGFIDLILLVLVKN